MIVVNSNNAYHALWKILVQIQDKEKPARCFIVFMVDLKQVFARSLYW